MTVGLTSSVAAHIMGLSFLFLPGMGISGAVIAWLPVRGIAALMIVVVSLKEWHWRKKVETINQELLDEGRHEETRSFW